MAWSIIRKATQEDMDKLENRAEAFCKRHSIEREDEWETWQDAAEGELDYFESAGFECAGHMRRLWKRIVGRALGNPAAEGVAYGHVGYHAE